jgi:hypothetical protein
MIPGRDEQQRRSARAEPVNGEQARGMGGYQRDDELVQALELAVQELRAPPQLPQRDTDGVAGDIAGPGTQGRQPGYQGSRRVPGEPGSQVIGPVRIRALAWLIVRVRSPAALRRATISARIASTAPSRPLGCPAARPDCAARAALTASSGSDLPCRRRSGRSERTAPAHPDASRGDTAGQPGPVAAGPLDAGQGDGPEPAQPAQQAGVASRGGRELPDAQQPADGIQRGGDMGICVSDPRRR